MKQHNKLLIGLAAGLFILSGSVNAAVEASKHDLTSATGGATQTTGVTDQICVFCHTPHGSDTGAPAPLWNKNLPAAGDFTNYDDAGTSTTLDGTASLTGSVSLACLSCHDGSQAMDTVLNAPSIATDYKYDSAGAEIDASNITSMNASAATFPSPVPNLGTDLQNDHPVSIEYAGGGITWAAIAAGNNVADSANDKAFNDPIFTAATGRMDVNGTLPLYNKGGEPFVECASCHDPHSSNVSFMRVSNAASAVCVTCHVK